MKAHLFSLTYSISAFPFLMLPIVHNSTQYKPNPSYCAQLKLSYEESRDSNNFLFFYKSRRIRDITRSNSQPFNFDPFLLFLRASFPILRSEKEETNSTVNKICAKRQSANNRSKKINRLWGNILAEKRLFVWTLILPNQEPRRPEEPLLLASREL